jgi:peptidoglycan/LPS O-acetylase OafA/YrhL
MSVAINNALGPAGEVAVRAPAAAPDGANAVATAPAEGSPSWLWRGRIPCLDGLRAASIALVFVEHIAIASGVHGYTLPQKVVGNIGVIGVDVFFAISGFLITLLLLREFRKTDTISLKGFYARRFLRLMPAAVAYLVTVAVLQWAGRLHATSSNWVHAVTYTVNFDPAPNWELGHLWSLSIEEHFYLVWPLALLFLSPQRLLKASVAWLVAAPVVRLAMLFTAPDEMSRFENWTFFRVDCIAAGCLLALLSERERFRQVTHTSDGVAMLLIAVSFALVVGGYIAGLAISAYGMVLEQTVRAVCIAAVIWLTINHFRTAWGRLLDSRPFVVVGVLSYSLYLWQQLFLTHAGGGAVGFMNRLPYALLFAIAAAVASHWLIERPFLGLKAQLDRHG